MGRQWWSTLPGSGISTSPPLQKSIRPTWPSLRLSPLICQSRPFQNLHQIIRYQLNVIADTASFRLEAATVKGHPAPSVAYYMGEHVASPGWDAAWTQVEWEANGYSVVSPGEDQDSMHGAFDFVAVATNQWATELKSVTADISAGDKVSLIENPVVDTATAGSLRITQAARVNVENPEIRYFYASGDSWNSPLDSVDPGRMAGRQASGKWNLMQKFWDWKQEDTIYTWR